MRSRRGGVRDRDRAAESVGDSGGTSSRGDGGRIGIMGARRPGCSGACGISGSTRGEKSALQPPEGVAGYGQGRVEWEEVERGESGKLGCKGDNGDGRMGTMSREGPGLNLAWISI